MKKLTCFILSVIMLISATVNIFALTDVKIFTDPVENTYAGRAEAEQMIENLRFTDVSANHWAKEAITRAGALDMIKGYDKKFNPLSNVSKQEAIAFMVRVMGLEQEAQTEGVNLKEYAESRKVVPVWSVGYLSVALKNELITQQDYDDALNPDQTAIPNTGFFKNSPASRQEVASWLVRAIEKVDANAFSNVGTGQALYQFSDWRNIDGEYAQDVEKCVAAGIMNGNASGTFSPEAALSRAEMAQILSNLDSIYNSINGYEKIYGTVGGIKDSDSQEVGKSDVWRNIYVRNDSGKIDVLQYQLESSSSPQANNKDAVVLKGGTVRGLTSLEEGDKIEYLVDKANKTVLFVNYEGDIQTLSVTGRLEQIDYDNGQIHVTDKSGTRNIFYIADGFYGNETEGKETVNYVVIDEKKIYNKDVPYGSDVKLSLTNNVVDGIEFVGTTVLKSEIRGIVIENNPNLGYITIIDNDGNEVTKNYYENSMVVEKQQYYDSQDEIGYLDQMFPNFEYDPRDTVISDIEAGDVVFMEIDEDDPSAISKISASTNYIMRYGKIRQINNTGDIYELMIEYENGQTAWFDVAPSIFISESGSPISITDMEEGSWVKLLVNEAIISGGYTIESVKEIMVEDSGHEISSIIKGQLASLNMLQKQIAIQDVYTLTKQGWDNYQQVKQFSIANSDISYYYNGNRISLDYAERFLKRADGNVYIAVENNYAGETVSMVSFRDSRTDSMAADTVINTDGAGTFATTANGSISTDSGTIIRRYGRLVTGSSIMIPDYAQVVLGADNKAAVVDIYEQPDTSGLLVVRGRILSIDEGNSFTVKSMSELDGMKWVYSPIEREFTVDSSTVYVDETGVVGRDGFIDYTEDSAINQVYNIVVDGSKAICVAKAPYCKEGVMGTAYASSDTSISLRDGSYYVSSSGIWDSVSSIDSSINVTIGQNTVIIKNNKLVGASAIENGDKMKVLIEELPDKITGSMTVNGYIVLVES